MATSTTTAPSFTMSPVMRPARPAAATRMSARRHSAFRSGVLVWQMVTVAFSRSMSMAWGFPTILDRPTMTQCLPAGSMPYSWSIRITPAGVQGWKPFSPIISCPTLKGWKQSTSLSGRMASRTSFSFRCLGRGSCTRMPSMSSRPFRVSTSSSSSCWVVSAGMAYSSL